MKTKTKKTSKPAPSRNSDPFEGFNDAKAFSKTPFILEGIYKVRVLKCKMVQSWKKNFLFVCELKILKSDNPERKAGSVMCWMLNFDHSPAQGNLKAFIAECMNAKPAEIDEDVAKACVDENGEQPLAGTILKAIAINRETKDGGDFTAVTWELVKPAA